MTGRVAASGPVAGRRRPPDRHARAAPPPRRPRANANALPMAAAFPVFPPPFLGVCVPAGPWL